MLSNAVLAAVQIDVDLCPGLLPPRVGLPEVVDLHVRRHEWPG